MVTVFQVAEKYAAEHNLPPFSRNQLSHIGNFISVHFKRFWAPKQSDEIIAQAGFVRTQEEGSTYLVCGYPDSFQNDMMTRIDILLAQKKAAIEKLSQKTKEESTLPTVVRKAPITDGEVKKRKRIPAKQ